jgi:holliday junction DNA helicase RuvA
VIARLRGTLVERLPGALVVDCRGVGYEVHCSGPTLSAAGPVGAEVTLRIYTQLQEDRLALYGFATAEERELFDLLITVKRIGPASAIKILSAGADPRDLARMIAAEQASALTSLKGVGKKAAEMLVVELRDRCRDLLLRWGAGADPAPVPQPPERGRRPGAHPLLDEVSGALVQLGWRPSEVDKAVAQLEVGHEVTLEGLLRQALRSMPR